MAINKLLSDQYLKANKSKKPKAMPNLEKTISELSEDKAIAKGKKETRALAGEMTKIARESRAFLAKAGMVMKTVALSASQATQAIAKSSINAVSKYTNAIKEDINVNKKNLTAMMIGRASPILGYFASKVFESGIFSRFKEGAKEKLGGAYRKIGDFLRSRKSGSDIGGIESNAMIEAAMDSAVGPPRLKRHSPAVLEIPIEKEKPKGLEENFNETREKMSIRADMVSVRATNVTLVGALEKSVQQQQNQIFEKFSRQFGEFSQKQEQQWSMFAWSITGGAPKKGSSFLKDFRTYFSRMIFPSFMSVQDQMLENTIAMRNAIAGPRKKVGTPEALWKSFLFVFKRTAFYRYSMMFFRSIGSVLTTIYKVGKFTLKTIWSPFKWFFFKSFKKFGPENYKLPKMHRGATPAQYTAQLVGALYQGTMYKFDELIHYTKLIGGALGADMKPFKKPAVTLYRKFLGPLINSIGVKLMGPIAAKSVTEVAKQGARKLFGFAKGKLFGESQTAAGGLLPGRSPGLIKRAFSGAMGKIKSIVSRPKSIEEALVLYTGRTSEAITKLYLMFKEEKRKEKLEELREKGKGLFKRITGWLITALGTIKTFISNTIGSVIPRITGALTSVLSSPSVISALGKGSAIIGAGVVGYQVGKYLNRWINDAVKKFTGENSLGEWAAESMYKHPMAKKILAGIYTGGASEVFGWYKTRSEKNKASSIRGRHYQSKMSTSAYNLMGNLNNMGIEEMAQRFVTLREEGMITRKGNKWVTLAEAARMQISETSPTHIGKELTARISTGYERMKEADLRKIWEEYGKKSGETWEDFKKKFGPMIAQSTQSVIQNTQNISNFIQQQGSKTSDFVESSMDRLISNDMQ